MHKPCNMCGWMERLKKLEKAMSGIQKSVNLGKRRQKRRERWNCEMPVQQSLRFYGHGISNPMLRERERKGRKENESIRGKERECVCVCVRERERRESERERARARESIFLSPCKCLDTSSWFHHCKHPKGMLTNQSRNIFFLFS